MNYQSIKSVYQVVGDKKFEAISINDNRMQVKTGSRIEARNNITDILKEDETNNITLAVLIKKTGFSRTSIQVCIKNLYAEKLIKKISAPTVSNRRTIAYVWANNES
jgi:hypothetical protein